MTRPAPARILPAHCFIGDTPPRGQPRAPKAIIYIFLVDEWKSVAIPSRRNQFFRSRFINAICRLGVSVLFFGRGYIQIGKQPLNARMIRLPHDRVAIRSPMAKHLCRHRATPTGPQLLLQPVAAVAA